MKRLVEVYEAEISPWVMYLLAQRGGTTVPVHKFGVGWGITWNDKYLCITNSCPYYALKESRIFK